MPNNNDQPPYYVKEKIDLKWIIAGGVIIGICGLGFYYLWSKQKLVDDVQTAVQEYKDLYDEFMEDGIITPAEQDVLDIKKREIDLLIALASQKGLIEQVTEMLFMIFGIGVPVCTVSWIIIKLMDRWLKRHPGAGGGTPEEPYVDPVDNTTYPEMDDLWDYAVSEHGTPAPGYVDELAEAWEMVNSLPDWLSSLLATLVGVPDAVGQWYGDLDPASQNLICMGVIAAILVLIALSAGLLLGPLMPVYDKFAAIPQVA